MRVVVIGSGAREHAIAWKLSLSPSVTALFAAPGNAGISEIARCWDLASDDSAEIVARAKREAIDLAIIGPEAPLVGGLADALRHAGIATFGPSGAAARLEGSKSFAKEIMRARAVPTADFAVFDDPERAADHVRAAGRPLVVKADGLAAGKGVVVASSTEEALEAIRAIMIERAFGDAGKRVVIEEVLRGPEVSYHVVCDGERYVPLAAAQDHKRLLEGDRGPNTGGMGAYSPPPVVTAEVEAKILSRIVEPTLAEMSARGTPLNGALFVGLMIVDGEPFVLEYNVRFGDPETEVLMMRWKGDVLPLFWATARGSLEAVHAEWDAPAAMSVVIAAEGYPGKPVSGVEIRNLREASETGAQVFHAGTRRDGDRILSSGGRVLCVTAAGESIDEAAASAYAAIDRIDYPASQHRRDIGWQARRSR